MAVTLRLQKVTEADPERGWAPAEFYDIVAGGEVVGSIQATHAPSECACGTGTRAACDRAIFGSRQA